MATRWRCVEAGRRRAVSTERSRGRIRRSGAVIRGWGGPGRRRRPADDSRHGSRSSAAREPRSSAPSTEFPAGAPAGSGPDLLLRRPAGSSSGRGRGSRPSWPGRSSARRSRWPASTAMARSGRSAVSRRAATSTRRSSPFSSARERRSGPRTEAARPMAPKDDAQARGGGSADSRRQLEDVEPVRDTNARFLDRVSGELEAEKARSQRCCSTSSRSRSSSGWTLARS